MENILLCKEVCRNEDGVFLAFEPLTFVPIDPALLCVNDLSEPELQQMVEYQKRVCEEIGAYLTPEEYQWLEKQKKII